MLAATEKRPPLDDVLDHSNTFFNQISAPARTRYDTPPAFYDDLIQTKTVALRNAISVWEFFAKDQSRISMTYKDFTWESVHEQLRFLRDSLRQLIALRIRIGGPGMDSDLKRELARAYEIISRQHSWSENSTPISAGMVTLEPEETAAGIFDFIDSKLLIIGIGAIGLFLVITSK